MRYRVVAVTGVALAAALAAGGYAIWPSEPLPPDARVESMVVLKSERKLILMNQGSPVREYRISLGRNPVGAKTQEGDGKTPEGSYFVDYRNEKSAFHLALHISYPNDTDRARASIQGVKPGGLIMIHGMRNHFGFIGRWHRSVDWTDGCISTAAGLAAPLSRRPSRGAPALRRRVEVFDRLGLGPSRPREIESEIGRLPACHEPATAERRRCASS